MRMFVLGIYTLTFNFFLFSLVFFIMAGDFDAFSTTLFVGYLVLSTGCVYF